MKKGNKKHWTIEVDRDGYFFSIAFKGQTILHVKPHTEFNVINLPAFVGMLNDMECVWKKGLK